MHLPNAAPLAAPLLACALALSSCFVGYDSRWGQAKAAQRRMAAESTPGAIQAAPNEPRPAQSTTKRTFHIRFRPNAHYLSQTVDAQHQLDDLVADADRVMGAAVGLHLVVDRIEPWSFDADERLEPTLAALNRDDGGQGVDVVVGLVGALPRPTESLHEVGYADVLGKHVVVRAASRLGEHDAFDRALADLSEDERNRVVRARRRHRAEAVFLHEMGHVLGALHEADPTSVMRPAYDPKMDSFGADAIALMRLALNARDREEAVRAQRDYIRDAKAAGWAPGARDEALAQLQEAKVTHPAQSSGTPADSDAAPMGAPVAVPTELSGDDRDRFVRAVQLMRGGAVRAAREEAQPLFAAYPNVAAVQELRCEIATIQWLDKSALLIECAGSVRLLDAGAEEPH